jgi:F0F1-type ATP synthase membrane subunit c/vacuolar-type H+-ATPase subunit K
MRLEEVTEIELLPVAVAMSSAFIAGSWCITQGSTINASKILEKRGTSVWGSLLSLIGACLISIGLFIAPIMLLEQISIPSMFVSGVLSLLIITLIARTAKSDGDEKGLKEALGKIGTIGKLAAIMIIVTLSLLLAPNIGGENEVIPENVWGPILGTIVMVSGLATASMAIMAGVKSGGEMLIANEGLSIWALLFVALGEGLAIYGLIVSILLIG